MSSESVVSYTLEGGIAQLQMDDGKANVMSPAMIQGISAALDRAEQDDARAVLLQGRPGMFSAGYDLSMFQQPLEVMMATLRAGGELVWRMFGFSRPILAVCGGHSIAQGAFIMLAADVRLATAGPFKIGLNEVKNGMTIPHYGVEIARARLTRPGFQRATLSAELFTPDVAQQLGFVDEVVPAEVLAERARERVEALAGLSLEARAGTLKRVRGATLQLLREGIDSELPAPGTASA